MAALVAGERDPKVLEWMARVSMRSKTARLEEGVHQALQSDPGSLAWCVLRADPRWSSTTIAGVPQLWCGLVPWLRGVNWADARWCGDTACE